MSNSILIMGESGTGKSTAIRNLDPLATCLINVLGKPLPFKGYRTMYSSDKGGNCFNSDDARAIISALQKIAVDRPEVTTIVIDDFQYIMANEYMRRATERGFDKFTDIGKNAWDVINAAARLPENIDVFFLTHTEVMTDGRIKCKTIGRMLDDKIVLEGMFTIVLHSVISDESFKFLTQTSNNYLAKSPMGMFEEKLIDNDLLMIKNKISEYYNEDINL